MIAVESDRLGSMFTFFLIALVIVAPFGFVRVRAVLRERRGDPADGDAPSTDDAPAPAVDPNDLAGVIAAITTAAAGLPVGSGEVHEVEVPRDVTVEGRPSDPTVVDALVGDAVRRSGLAFVWLDDGDGPRRLRLSRP